jgi:hypothetical protein
LSVPIPVAVITNPTTNVIKYLLNTSIVPIPVPTVPTVPTNNNNIPISNRNRNLLKIHFTS